MPQVQPIWHSNLRDFNKSFCGLPVRLSLASCHRPIISEYNSRMNTRLNALILGLSIVVGLSALGFLIGEAAIEYRQMERRITVKGLAEQEFPADVVIWPIQFNATSNSLDGIYQSVESNTQKIQKFLVDKGVTIDEISAATPAITDKWANQYGNEVRPQFRYLAYQTVTVYSRNIDLVRSVMQQTSQLGKTGVTLTGNNYDSQTEYLFTRLNEVKPQMIEQATRNAREVAEKFASDSQSKLGKIKRASQGQFSISARDKNNPHIKRVRVVSTIEYYLSD